MRYKWRDNEPGEGAIQPKGWGKTVLRTDTRARNGQEPDGAAKKRLFVSQLEAGV